MAGNALIREIPITEYERIRRYVIGEIVKSGDSPKRLASTRELAKRFDVSRTTVLKALKDLVDDGFITAKPGRLGAFTCPSNIRRRKDSRIVGLLIGDGKNVFTTRMQARYVYEFGDAIQTLSSQYQVQHLFLTGMKANAAEELVSLGVHCVAWILPAESLSPAIEELKRRGVPQLCIGTYESIPGISQTLFDVETEYFEATGLMLDEGRRRVALVLQESCEAHSRKALKGWRRAYEARGIAFDETLALSDSARLEREFGDLLKRLRPDGLCFACSLERYFKDLTTALDIERACRVYSFYCNISANLGRYIGYVGLPLLAPAMRLAAKNIDCQFEDIHAARVANIAIETEIKLLDTAKEPVL